MNKFLIITQKTDIPGDTVSRKGFHLLNMGRHGTWLVDQEHPGWPGCLKKAIKIAIQDNDSKRAESYKKLPGYQENWINPMKVWVAPEVLTPEEEKASK